MLAAFAKTKCLEPGEEQKLTLEVKKQVFSSYDDSGLIGHKSCYVLEAGEYRFYVGTDVRSARLLGCMQVKETEVTEQCTEALAPVEGFERIKPVPVQDGIFAVSWEKVPMRTYCMAQRCREEKKPEVPYTGDRGYKLSDVYDHAVTMEEFVGQLSAEDLCCIVRGEGMCSPKVTPGTASAFGGVTKSLESYGIPCGCCADGPSGIRMDCGTYAFSLPNGTCLACSFNEELVEQLYEMEGAELRKNHIDILLGPGMNIHRHPLNGRNFEYFSEDPLLTGKMAAAQIRGMGKYKVTGALKHFAANNQEYNRRKFNSVVSERALREIYLKGFEMAVKEGGAYAVMTTYGRISKEEQEASEMMLEEDRVDFDMRWYALSDRLELDGKDIDTGKGKSFVCGLRTEGRYIYKISIRVKVDASELAQIPVSIFTNGTLQKTVTLNGTGGKYVMIEQPLGTFLNSNNYLKLFFAEGGMQIDKIKIEFAERMESSQQITLFEYFKIADCAT